MGSHGFGRSPQLPAPGLGKPLGIVIILLLMQYPEDPKVWGIMVYSLSWALQGLYHQPYPLWPDKVSTLIVDENVPQRPCKGKYSMVDS